MNKVRLYHAKGASGLAYFSSSSVKSEYFPFPMVFSTLWIRDMFQYDGPLAVALGKKGIGKEPQEFHQTVG
jgi:hypothetical protein